MTPISTVAQPVSTASTPSPLPWTSEGPMDPLALTEEKAKARDAEAKTADRNRFWSWAEVRNALRNQSL
jgi:hypothetical protein